MVSRREKGHVPHMCHDHLCPVLRSFCEEDISIEVSPEHDKETHRDPSEDEEYDSAIVDSCFESLFDRVHDQLRENWLDTHTDNIYETEDREEFPWASYFMKSPHDGNKWFPETRDWFFGDYKIWHIMIKSNTQYLS